MSGTTEPTPLGAQAGGYRLVFADDFDGQRLDRSRWLPAHLPQWSSRERATGGRARSAAARALVHPAARLGGAALQDFCPARRHGRPVADRRRGRAGALGRDLRVRDLRQRGRAGRALVGMGVHPFGDPSLRDDFTKVPLELDATAFHVYAAEWTADAVHLLGRLVLCGT